MSAATQGTKTMLEAIDLEAENARLRTALAFIASPATWIKATDIRAYAREALAFNQDREANPKPDPTIAKDLDREEVEPGLAPPSVAGEDR